MKGLFWPLLKGTIQNLSSRNYGMEDFHIKVRGVIKKFLEKFSHFFNTGPIAVTFSYTVDPLSSRLSTNYEQQILSIE